MWQVRWFIDAKEALQTDGGEKQKVFEKHRVDVANEVLTLPRMLPTPGSLRVPATCDCWLFNVFTDVTPARRAVLM